VLSLQEERSNQILSYPDGDQRGRSSFSIQKIPKIWTLPIHGFFLGSFLLIGNSKYSRPDSQIPFLFGRPRQLVRMEGGETPPDWPLVDGLKDPLPAGNL